MNIHTFLNYWSDHNDMIIKVLIAMVLLMIIFLAFRVFFGAETPIVTSTASLDTAQLEKTLQKILEAQAKTPVMAVPTSGDAASSETLKSAGASSSSTVAELEALKKDLAEKEKLLIQVRNEAAKAAANASSASAGAVAAASNNSAIKLETKIKDLEARLAEYEIISEDIADLSFYKEENSRLQNELTTRKASGGGSSSGSGIGGQGVVTEPISPPVAKASTQNLDSTATPAATSSAVPATGSPGSVLNLQSAGSTAVTSLTGEPVASVGVSSADSDLMKEFEKAVEQQKSTEAPPAASQSAENSQLMNQFENFVKKS